ncbi:L-asparaginase 2-4 [Curvularia clavata]|uniref:asparaginase n=1 Tax=Curvularia clavata TaxID=95742 RepID=A0A9Q9DXT3_CURCL|nr:L-asparaginase 2-4 [Curvularia clavata]
MIMEGSTSGNAPSLPYREPDIITILVQASFLLLLNIINSVLDRVLYCGLLGQVLVGIAWGTPGTKLLSTTTEEAIVQLGYLGLILLVFEGGLSTSFQSLKANLLLSSGVALTGIAIPIGLSYTLQGLLHATPLQAFAAGAALCSTSLGTTFTVLASSGLSASRLGVVLTSAAMMDDVVGLVMVQVISNLGGTNFSWVVIVRPVLVSVAFALVVPVACLFIAKPITLRINRYREAHRNKDMDGLLSKPQTAFLLHTLLLVGLVAAATYAGTSNLFAAYIAGASISWWDSEVPHLVVKGASSETQIVGEKSSTPTGPLQERSNDEPGSSSAENSTQATPNNQTEENANEPTETRLLGTPSSYDQDTSGILYTGGTIAGGSIYGALDDTQYGQLSQTGEQIIARNPYLLNHTQLAVSNWTTEDDGSTGTNDALVMNMTRFTHDALCSPDSDIVGAVYTHGTNSLEETAFLLDSLVNCEKPVVGTGSMRPFTHLSYEGDANFFDAVMLAASPASRNRGGMVAFNARIIPGYWATKLYSTNPDAFGANTGGDLGLFINSLPVFYNSPSQPLFKHFFDIDAVSAHSSFPALPKVDILYAAREFDGRLLLNAQANGAKGVVIAGTGNGGIPNGQEEVAEALEKGLQVVVGTRTPFGPSSPAREPTYAKAGFAHPIQARIMLQLAIASGMGMNETIEMFEGGFRRAIGQPWEPET